MENSSEKDTLPNLQTVLDAVNGLRSEMNERFDRVETRLTGIEIELNQITEKQFVFENNFDRVSAALNHNLSLSYENRPNIRIMRRKIEALVQSDEKLERKVA